MNIYGGGCFLSFGFSPKKGDKNDICVQRRRGKERVKSQSENNARARKRKRGRLLIKKGRKGEGGD